MQTNKSNRIELHIAPDPEFTRTHGARLKRIGGTYSAARGDATRRFVHVPLTAEGIRLAEEIAAAYPLASWGKVKPAVAMIRGRRIDALHSRPGRIAADAKRFAKQHAAAARKAREQRAQDRAARIRWQREQDARTVHEGSLAAGERMAAEFLFG